MKIELIKKNINFGGIVTEINITEDLNNEIINLLLSLNIRQKIRNVPRPSL